MGRESERRTQSWCPVRNVDLLLPSHPFVWYQVVPDPVVLLSEKIGDQGEDPCSRRLNDVPHDEDPDGGADRRC